jgi:hypothetical protein
MWLETGKSCMHQYYQMEVNLLNNNQLFGLVIVKRPVTYPTDQPRATEVGKEISKQLSNHDVISAIHRHFINPRSCDCILTLLLLLTIERPEMKLAELGSAVELIGDVVNELNLLGVN